MDWTKATNEELFRELGRNLGRERELRGRMQRAKAEGDMAEYRCQESILRHMTNAIQARAELEHRKILVPPDLAPTSPPPDLGNMVYELRQACPETYRQALESVIQKERDDPEFEGLLWDLDRGLHTETYGFLTFLDDMRPGLFHFTTSANWEKIKMSGFIEPSGKKHSGAFDYDRSNPHLAAVKKAVALFDFKDLPREKCLQLADKYSSCFSSLVDRETREGVWLTIDRKGLPSELEKVVPTEENIGTLWLPYLEAFHSRPIPIACVKRAERIHVAVSGEVSIGSVIS